MIMILYIFIIQNHASLKEMTSNGLALKSHCNDIFTLTICASADKKVATYPQKVMNAFIPDASHQFVAGAFADSTEDFFNQLYKPIQAIMNEFTLTPKNLRATSVLDMGNWTYYTDASHQPVNYKNGSVATSGSTIYSNLDEAPSSWTDTFTYYVQLKEQYVPYTGDYHVTSYTSYTYDLVDGNGSVYTKSNPVNTASHSLHWVATQPTTVNYYLQQLDGTYKLQDTVKDKQTIGSTFAPQVKSYTGYTSPEAQTKKVVMGGVVIDYKYDLIHYKVTVDTAGGEWYKEQTDGTWIKITPPVSDYTVLTPTFTLPVPDKTGYKFVGYTGTGLSDKTVAVTIPQGSTGDRSYTAQWEGQAYEVEVPYELDFDVKYDGLMTGSFDQDGDGKADAHGYVKNHSTFPVQVTNVKFSNSGDYTMTDTKSSADNIMNWRLDATQGSSTWNQYASAFQSGAATSSNDMFWLAQNDKGVLQLDASNGWVLHDTPKIKTKKQIGSIVWTFDIGHRKFAN